jgi:hypothetical protein
MAPSTRSSSVRSWERSPPAATTAPELAGLLQAARERIVRWAPGLGQRAISIPAYGLVRGEALVVSLAAAMLRRFEVPVIVHGILDSPCGVSAACVLRELGVLPCGTLSQAEESLREMHAAYLPGAAPVAALRDAGGASQPPGPGERLAPRRAGDRSHRRRGDARRLQRGRYRERALRPPRRGERRGPPAAHLAVARSPANLATRPRMERVSPAGRELLFEADPQEVRSNAATASEDALGMARWIQRVMDGSVPAAGADDEPAGRRASTLRGRAKDLAEAKAIAAFGAGRLAA